MAADTQATPRRGARRSMFRPPGELWVVTQPPTELAHLTGNDLFHELTTVPRERWKTSRAAAECGREPDTLRSWISYRYRYNAAVEAEAAAAEREGRPARPVPHPQGTKMTPTPDGYEGRSPWWWDCTMRTWMIQEGLMTRAGVKIPYRPTGRPPGALNRAQKTPTRWMEQDAPGILRMFEALQAAGHTTKQAYAEIAAQTGKSVRQVERRVVTGRALRRQETDLKVTKKMPAAEVDERVRRAFALLAGDGRRRNQARIRQAVAKQLGVTAAVVDRALGPEQT